MHASIQRRLWDLLPRGAQSRVRTLQGRAWLEDATPLCDVAPTDGGSRRALLSYLPGPLRLTEPLAPSVPFSNAGIARGIVASLHRLGFTVDIVRFDDTAFLPQRSYDLFVGHAGVNFRQLADQLAPATPAVYFAASTQWEFFNAQEAARHAALAARRGVDLPPDRQVEASEEWALTRADGIIALGNGFAAETYARYPAVYTLHNAAFDETRSLPTKHYEEARRHFCFFAGGGNVHKGLDVLLEAFAESDAHLHVATYLEPAFAKIYERELTRCPNIHALGWVRLRSRQFYDLMAHCAYAVLPSCSEGSPGSVVECMYHGLIPVVSREATLDTDDFGVMLESCEPTALARTVRELTALAPETVTARSARTLEVARTAYSATAFVDNMTAALAAILDRHAARQPG